MQERRDRFGFVRAVFQRNRSDAENMRDIGILVFFRRWPP
jgi:hypothetical protein